MSQLDGEVALIIGASRGAVEVDALLTGFYESQASVAPARLVMKQARFSTPSVTNVQRLTWRQYGGRRPTVATCTTCGNEYDKAFSVTTHDGQNYVFDSVECAAHLIAPVCAHCGCRVLGHGVEATGQIFCCASCAAATGAERLQDRV